MSQGHLHSYLNRSMEVRWIFPKDFLDVFLWVIRFFPNTVRDNLQDEFTINNSNYQKQPTLVSRPSHLPTSLSHIAMLPLVSTVISSSFSSFAWEVVPNLPKCGEMIRHVQSNRATRTFSSRNGTQQHGRHMSFLRVTCHLQQYSGWWNRYMEDRQDSKEVHVKWRCL